MAKNEFKETSVFKILIKICKKIFEICGKNPNVYPKDVCSFSVAFV